MVRNRVRRLPQKMFKTHKNGVLVMCNIDDFHWGMMYVSLDYPKHLRVFIYDPMIAGNFQEILYDIWVTYVKSYLLEWVARDVSQAEAADYVKRARITYVNEPRQADGTSCGFYCIAMADAFAHQRFELQGGKSTMKTIELVRLRTLHMILHDGERVSDPEEDVKRKKNEQVLQRLKEYAKNSLSSEENRAPKSRKTRK